MAATPTEGLNREQRKALARRLQATDPGLDVMHPNAAGIDVGNSAHYVAVRDYGSARGHPASWLQTLPGRVQQQGPRSAMRSRRSPACNATHDHAASQHAARKGVGAELHSDGESEQEPDIARPPVAAAARPSSRPTAYLHYWTTRTRWLA
jgi:hypothetical protein